MDPLTHTLVGASLAATRLGEKTRYAAPALLIGANLPDVDVLAYVAGSDAALGFRRGWTHGAAALVLLPPLLAAGLWLWDRSRKRRRQGPPLSTAWLLGLSYLAVATHPGLDWLNTYGMRWWMPFRDGWSYGDALFIMDPWLWLLLGTGWLSGRRPSRALVTGWALAAALLSLVAAARAPAYVALVALVFAALLAALLWRPRREALTAQRTATVGLLLAALYIGALLGLHAVTERRVVAALARQGIVPAAELMVGPVPVNPARWEVVVRAGPGYRHGSFSWSRRGSLALSPAALPAADATTPWAEIAAGGQASGFRRWVRFPWLEVEADGPGRRVYLMDARYTRRRTLGFGGTAVTLPPATRPAAASSRP